jgi:hypothetical protein
MPVTSVLLLVEWPLFGEELPLIALEIKFSYGTASFEMLLENAIMVQFVDTALKMSITFSPLVLM